MARFSKAVGIDIGGTGIKGAIVDLDSGDLLSERVKIPTPKGGSPEAITDTVVQILETLGKPAHRLPVGVCFPAVVRHGYTMSAVNVAKEWIGLNAVEVFQQALGRPICFLNDADAAGFAELHYGAARNVDGTVILTTLGTGIGSALIYNGHLVPNTELGHLELNGTEAEKFAANSARERENLDWAAWAKRLQLYYEKLEYLFSPELFVVGGGVSKASDDFLPLLALKTKIVAAHHRNNAGILGAAAHTRNTFGSHVR